MGIYGLVSDDVICLFDAFFYSLLNSYAVIMNYHSALHVRYI